MDWKLFFITTLMLSGSYALSGCSLIEPPVKAADGKPVFNASMHESAMRKQWADKPYRELVKHMGRKGYVMDIPRYGWPASSAVVYGVNAATGCVDAFLVLHGKEPMVKDYFCR